MSHNLSGVGEHLVENLGKYTFGERVKFGNRVGNTASCIRTGKRYWCRIPVDCVANEIVNGRREVKELIRSRSKLREPGFLSTIEPFRRV